GGGCGGGGRRRTLPCRHCFISWSPHNHNFGFLDLATVRRSLEESVALGVKEYYFTGGEPFLNGDMVPILELTLTYGPATVLTNGTVFKAEWLRRLRRGPGAPPPRPAVRASGGGVPPAGDTPPPPPRRPPRGPPRGGAARR